jgi:hypothetical protein
MTSELSSLAARVCDFIAVSILANGEVDQRACIETTFAGLASDLFAAQFRVNTPYRKLCEARNATPSNIVDWRNIPAMPTAAFKELELTCLSVPERSQVFHSSGTTEQRPSRHFHNAESLAVYEASLWPWFCEHVRLGEPPSDLAILTPPPAQAPNSSLVHMFETIRRRSKAPVNSFLGATTDGAWSVDIASTIAAMEAAQRDEKPLLVLGTAFSFVHLVDAFEARKLRLRLPPGSTVMETGGYKGRSRVLPKAELHALISRFLGVPATQIVCEYGMSEISSQAYDLVARATATNVVASPRVFHFPPWARVQVISPETDKEVDDGETGLLRLFDLANVFSVVAIQTEDLGVRRGDGFELLGRATTAEARGCSLMAV